MVLCYLGFPGGSVVKNPPVSAGDAGDTGWFLGQEDSLEQEIATHSSILAWKSPMDRGAWWAIAHRVANSWTQLSTIMLLTKKKQWKGYIRCFVNSVKAYLIMLIIKAQVRLRGHSWGQSQVWHLRCELVPYSWALAFCKVGLGTGPLPGGCCHGRKTQWIFFSAKQLRCDSWLCLSRHWMKYHV